MVQASTPCSISNEFGQCEGTRQCGFTGLTLCDVQAPQAEICNGLDDNCNGEVDELDTVACELSNEFGSCSVLSHAKAAKKDYVSSSNAS